MLQRILGVRQFDDDDVLSGQRSRLYSNTGILRDTAIVDYHLQSHHIAGIEALGGSLGQSAINLVRYPSTHPDLRASRTMKPSSENCGVGAGNIKAHVA